MLSKNRKKKHNLHFRANYIFAIYLPLFMFGGLYIFVFVNKTISSCVIQVSTKNKPVVEQNTADVQIDTIFRKWFAMEK